MKRRMFFTKFSLLISLVLFAQNSFASCYITLGRLKLDHGAGSAVISIKSPDDGLCTKEDLIKTWQDIKDPFDAKRFVALITAFFMGVEIEPGQKWKNFDKSGKASFFVAETPSAKPDGSMPTFENVFGVNFDSSRFAYETEVDDTFGQSLLNPVSIARLSLQGYGLAEISGSFRELGDDLSFAFNTVIYGQRIVDQESFKAQLQSMALVNGALAELNSAIVENIQLLNTDSDKINLYSETLFAIINGIEFLSIQAIQEAQTNLQNAETNIASANATVVSTVSQAKLESQMTADEIARNRAGMIKASQVSAIDQGVSSEIDKFELSKSLTNLKNISQLYLQDKNPLRKNQYKGILDKYTNQFGFVKTWYDALPYQDRFKFTVSDDAQYGPMIRQIGNQALGSMLFEKDDIARRDAERAWQLVARADRLYGKKDATPVDKLLAMRYLNRAQLILDYANKDPKTNAYKNFKTNDTVVNTFGYDVRGDTEQGFEFASVANRLVKYEAALNQTSAKLHGALALERAFLALSSDANRDDFYAAIDSVWGVINYLDGVDAQLGQWAWDMASGTYQLVRHPIDSAEALATAISNYKMVWQTISNGVQERYGQIRTCDSDAFSCGQASGWIATTIVDTVAAIKAIKAAPELVNLAKAVTAATARSLQGIFKSLVQLGFGSREFLSEFVKKAKGIGEAEKIIAGLGEFSESTRGALQELGVATPEDLIAVADAARGTGKSVSGLLEAAKSLGMGTIDQVKRVAEWLKTPLIPGEAGTIQIELKGQIFVDLSTPQKRTHILLGDDTGGGHMFPGKPGKSVFPESWSGDKIMHEVADVVTDPKVAWEPGKVIKGKQRYMATGVREGVEIVVIVEPDGVGIVTSWPQSGPGVIRNPK